MLFRRIKAHIAKEDWFAVMIDFIIVVFGVFMGIQVQAYYQEQNDQVQMKVYLGRLYEDISLSLTGTERTKAFVNQNRENLKIVVDSVDNCLVEASQQDNFANGLFHIGKLIPEQFVDGTLTELRASGRLLLIDNSELRNAINETVREHEYLARVWPAIQARAQLDRDYVDRKIIFKLDRQINGFSQAYWRELDIELDQICNDREYKARLAKLLRMASINIDWLDRNLKNFRAVKTLLEEELGGS